LLKRAATSLPGGMPAALNFGYPLPESSLDRAAPVSASATVGEIPDCSFGRFTLEPAQRRLLMDGQPVSLGARAFDLLVVLVARAGRLVSKQELLTSVWPGLVVEENNLQVPDGVWWVELAPLADGEHVVATVARVLDTQLSAERPPVDTIAAVLAAQRALLVLDNCEHVSDAVASLVEVACGAAGVGRA